MYRLDLIQPIALMRDVTLRLGRAKMVAATTGVSVLMSVVGTVANLYLFGFLAADYITLASLAIAVVIPLTVAFPVSWLTVSVVFYMHQLETKMRRLATYDALTGLLNRRAFLEEANTIHRAVTQRAGHFALLLLDLDHFKQINDTHGHAAGDHVLEDFGKIVHAIVDSAILAARIGGEEFAFLLPDSTTEQAWHFAEALHQAIRSMTVVKDGHSIRCTASMGLVVCSPFTSIERAMSLADKALYRAKANGRNQSVFYTSDAPDLYPTVTLGHTFPSSGRSSVGKR